ncbi:MAG: glycosyltransferase family 9 protein [Candidatus Wallbacteria bacterium]|nr:glycosyltransferase family 9 protein [Candidatus Wallbacteria bacterium]
MKILVLRPGAMGDLLLALPAIRALATRRPDDAIEVAGNGAFTPLLSLCPWVSATHDFGSRRFTPLFAEAPPPPALRTFLARFELAVLWMRDPGGAVAARLRDCGVARTIGGDPAAAGTAPMALRLARLLGDLCPAELDLKCANLDAGRLPPRQSKPPIALFHPGSGGQAKLWGAEQFTGLAWRLKAVGLRPRILEGPADAEAVAALAERLAAPIVRPPDALALAATIAGASLFAGNDSGPSHLAAALGVPTIAVFGPTDPGLWAPSGPRASVLGGNGVWPSPEEAAAEAVRLWQDRAAE